MNCVIYKGIKKEGSYLFVEDEGDIETVPEALLMALGELEFVVAIELTLQKKLAQADAAEVLKQIQVNGYYLQVPPKNPMLGIYQNKK